MSGRQWLRCHHVKPCPRNFTSAKRMNQCIMIDRSAATGVDQDAGTLHLAECLGVKKVARLGNQRCMDRDKITLGQNYFKISIFGANLPSDIRLWCRAVVKNAAI